MLFAAIYAIAVLAALVAGCLWRGRILDAPLSLAVLILAAGAATGGLVAWCLAGRLADGRPATARFAAILLLLIPATAGFAGLFFALHHAWPYLAGHGPAFGREWWEHAPFAVASAGYMFAATGLPLFLPFGLPVLFAAAWGFVRAGPGRAAIVGRGRVC